MPASQPHRDPFGVTERHHCPVAGRCRPATGQPIPSPLRQALRRSLQASPYHRPPTHDGPSKTQPSVRHVRQKCVKISPVTHVTPITHTRRNARSAALFGRLKDRHALDMVGHWKHVNRKQVKENRRSATRATQVGLKINVRCVRDARYVRAFDARPLPQRTPAAGPLQAIRERACLHTWRRPRHGRSSATTWSNRSPTSTRPTVPPTRTLWPPSGPSSPACLLRSRGDRVSGALILDSEDPWPRLRAALPPSPSQAASPS